MGARVQLFTKMTPVELLLESIEEAGSFVLADPETAAYFRMEFAKKPQPVKPAPEIVLPPPKPIEKKPIVEAVKPPPPKPIVKQEAPKPIVQEEISNAPVIDFSSLRSFLSVIAPELAILNEIPSDAIAKKISERWKTKNQTAPISILSWQEPPAQRTLLEQIAKALDVSFGGAKLVAAESIEKEKQWEAFLSVADLKMVIVCDYTLWQLNGLMQFYKETPAQGIRTLGNVPLFLLPDLSLYLKDHLLKRSLWKALCQKFS